MAKTGDLTRKDYRSVETFGQDVERYKSEIKNLELKYFNNWR